MMMSTIKRSGNEVVEYGGGNRDGNKMVIGGVEGDDLSPVELPCNYPAHNWEQIE